MNSVSVISVNTNLTFEKRLKLKRLGPPRPNLNIAQVQNAFKSKSSYARKFSPSLYELADWLCGCEFKNAFFCYTCLVMNVSDHAGISVGVSDVCSSASTTKSVPQTQNFVSGK